MRKLRGITVLIVSLACSGVVLGGDWPQWRGPDRTGLSTETGIAAKWAEGGPKLIWKATGAGKGFSSVVVKDGRVFTLGERADGEYLVAFDLKTGKELWSQPMGDGYKNKFGNGPRSTPTVDGDRVFGLGASGQLWAVSTHDGKPIWHHDLIAKFGGESIIEKFKGKKTIRWGLSESPLVEGDLLICNVGAKGGSIIAFNKTNGETVWRSKGIDDVPGYASAIAVTMGDVRQIINYTGKRMLGLNVNDGSVLWEYDKTAKTNANHATPIFHDGNVFMSGKGTSLVKLIADHEKFKVEEVYHLGKLRNHHGGSVLVGDHVYGVYSKGLTCVDLKTGETKWKDRGVGPASISYADGKLFCVGEKGKVSLVKASPDKFEELSSFSIEPIQKTIWAHPVISDQRLLIRNADEILCYDVKRADEQG